MIVSVLYMCVGTGTGSTDLSVPRMIQSMTLRSPPDAKDGLIFETQMGGVDPYDFFRADTDTGD